MLFLPIYIGPSSAIIRHWGCSTVPGSRLNIGGLLACLQRRIHTCAYKTVVNQATFLKNGSITILPMEISPRSSVSWHTIERAPAVMRFLVAMLSRSDLCAAVLVVSGTRNPTRNCVGLWFPGGGGMTSHIIRESTRVHSSSTRLQDQPPQQQWVLPRKVHPPNPMPILNLEH